MSYIKLLSNINRLRSGEELFKLENDVIGIDRVTLNYRVRSCNVEEGVSTIEVYENFYMDNNLSEIIVAILDKDDKSLWAWLFDNSIGTAAPLEVEALISYLKEKYDCPIRDKGKIEII